MGTVNWPTFGSPLDANMSVAIQTPMHHVYYSACIALFIVNLALSMFSLIFGVVSWILIPKWRQLQNFVFMTIIVSSTFNMVGYHFCFHHHYSPAVVILILLLPRITTSHWLLVANVMFYMQFVKVYNFELSDKYFMLCIFSWLVPFIEVSFVYTIDKFSGTRITVEFCYIMALIFLWTSVILLSVTIMSSVSTLNVWWKQSKTYKSIFSYVVLIIASSIPSGLTSLLPLLTAELIHSSLLMYGIVVTLCMLTITTGYIAFLSMKIHRELWYEYIHPQRGVNNV